MEDKNSPLGSGRDVKSFSTFCEGDTEPTLNKKILSLIDTEDQYIIYLDDGYNVQWSYLNSYEKKVPKSFASIANRLGHLETLSKTQLRPLQREPFARLLAEGMARIIGDRDEIQANGLLDQAASYLHLRGTENARSWYIRGSLLMAIPFFFAICLFWTYRLTISQSLGIDAFDVALGAFTGALGALFSILTRSDDITMDPAAGTFIHYLESASRIVAGSLGALLMALAVKSNVVLGLFKSADHSFALLLALCFCAGTSERFVSGLIGKIQSSAASNQKQKSGAA